MSLQNEEIPGPRLRHGLLWWWIEAPSAEAIIQTYAEVMIVEPADGEAERFADIPSLRIGDPAPAGLMIWRNSAGLSGPARSSGRWGRGSVYIGRIIPRNRKPISSSTTSRGYRTRQVVVSAGGEAERSGPADWFSIRRRICGIRSWRSVRLRGRSLRGGGESAANGLIAFEKF